MVASAEHRTSREVVSSRYAEHMPAKPNPEMDERVSIPLDPELAIRALLKVDPDAEPAEDQQRPKTPGKPAR